MILSGLFAAVVTILGWVVFQIVLLGFFDRRYHFKVRFFFYVISLALFLIWQWDTSALNILNGMLIHLLLFFTFMEFYYAIDRPVTLRILVEAKRSINQVLDIRQLHQIYDLNFMIGKRLHILTNTGYLFFKEGRYYLTPKGKIFAKIFERGSKLFGVRFCGKE